VDGRRELAPSGQSAAELALLARRSRSISKAEQGLEEAGEEAVDAASRHEFVQHTVVEHPQLWSLETPHLYQVRTTILAAGRPVDSTTTTFGIRTIHFDADKGFFLNGKHFKIYGVANHQDLPAVGIAVPDSLQFWRVGKLKEMGCNGWRTAHNEPNEAVLDACDRLGMLVMAENRQLGDSYDKSASGTTYTNLSDLTTLIQHDRNHPSIIAWSMGNEDFFNGGPADRVIALLKKSVMLTHQLDPAPTGRPAAIGGAQSKVGGVEPGTLGDVAGYNGDGVGYDNPGVPNMVSEYGADVSSVRPGNYDPGWTPE
jgi:beta-galactosidase